MYRNSTSRFKWVMLLFQSHDERGHGGSGHQSIQAIMARGQDQVTFSFEGIIGASKGDDRVIEISFDILPREALL